jgi:hypothetical protein
MAENNLFLWLHGLMAIVLDNNNIRIITPGPAAEHACLLGRVTSSDTSTWKLAPVKGWFVLEGISAPAVLPSRSPQFGSFVIEDVSDVRYDQSAFVLTVPLPDAILPLRITIMQVQPRPDDKAPPFPTGKLPLLVVFQYNNANLDRVRIPGLWQPPSTDGPVHLHLYVEPDPRQSNGNPLHNPQLDLDMLVDLFPSTKKFDVVLPTNTDRVCSVLLPDPNITGVLRDDAGAAIEQLDLWEWFKKCNDPETRLAQGIPPLTIGAGICPTGVMVLKGVNWV